MLSLCRSKLAMIPKISSDSNDIIGDASHSSVMTLGCVVYVRGSHNCVVLALQLLQYTSTIPCLSSIRCICLGNFSFRTQGGK